MQTTNKSQPGQTPNQAVLWSDLCQLSMNYHNRPFVTEADQLLKRERNRRKRQSQKDRKRGLVQCDPERGAKGSVQAAVSALKSDQIRTEMRKVRAARKGGPKHSTEAFETYSVGAEHPEIRALISSAKSHLSNPLNEMRPWRLTRNYKHGALTDSTAGSGGSLFLNLDNLPDYVEFTAIFDQYRFTKCKVKFIPRATQHTLTTMAVTGTQYVNPITVAFDPDDATTPSSEAQVLAYSCARTYPGTQAFEYDFKPRAAIAAYSGAFSSYADFDGWCDCASDDIEWYSLKYHTYGDGATQTTHQVWDIYCYCEIEFRFMH